MRGLELFWSVLAATAYAVAILACLPATFLVIDSFLGQGISAPQSSQLAAQACALVIVPYVAGRSFAGFARISAAWREADAQNAQTRQLDEIARMLRK